jgi:murein DD-endopeptidase MepM/ murein hydrolase activator NlpD
MRRAILPPALILLASLPGGCASQRAILPEPPIEALSDPYAPEPRGHTEHTVKPGETLFHIAQLYGVDVHLLQAQNEIARPEDLRVGQVLLITPATHAPIRRTIESVVGPLAWPVHGLLVSRFGNRGREHHDGIDIAAPEGSPVSAAAPGVVIFSGEQRGYGNLAVIDHGRGEATVYAHCERILVAQGQSVSRGQVIARVGRTGRATGPHLHFEVRQHAQPQNPLEYLTR